MGKKILSGIGFFLILLVLIAAASYVVLPKNNTRAAGMHTPQANGFLGEPENTIDVLFLGNSESYCGFIPLEIWKEQGITSYVCGSSDQKLYETEQYLRSVFHCQSPKLVVVETLALYRDYGRTEVLPEKAEEWLPLLRYHDRWKSLRAEDWYKPVRYTHIRGDKGYHLYREMEAADTAGYMAPTEDVDPIASKNVKHIRYIRDFCQENGAELVLVSVPSTFNWNRARHNSVSALAESLGITYLDLNLMPEEVPIDWETDTRDWGDHMNYTGAKKVSAFMGKWLAETGLFEDKRSWDAYSQWNQFLQEYLEDKEVARSDYDK